MWRSIKNFKVSYSYPLEHPIKVVIKKLGRQGMVGWLFQKFAAPVPAEQLVVSERIIELSLLQQWLGQQRLPLGAALLEIGHVASDVALSLASLGYRVTAIDPRPYPFSHPNLTSMVGDFLTHQFEGNFDFIFSISTIEHLGFSKRYGGADLPDNHYDIGALAKIAGLLKDNGRVVISAPYARSWHDDIWFRVYTRRSIEDKLTSCFDILEKRYYYRKSNQWFLAELVNDPLSPHDGVALFLLKKSERQ